MVSLLLGIFVALHGLVHLWYVTLAQGLVEYRDDMGWTAESWLLSGALGEGTLRALATALYLLAAIALVGSGVGLAFGADWARQALAASAVFSTVVVLLFWDGGTHMLVQKGFLALVINAALLGGLALTD